MGTLNLAGNSAAGGVSIVVTGSRALAATDNGATLSYSGSSNITLTTPSGLPTGFSCTIVQLGTGIVTMAAGSGTGFDNTGNTSGINTFLVLVQPTANQYAFQNPVPAGPVNILNTALPLIVPSSGSMGNNGALTLTTALNTTYPNCFMYLPAGAISSTSTAGWYYTVMSSTTAGTVYNNQYVSGAPSVPASPTAFATTGPGAYTQVLTAITALNFTLPGGSLGPNGSLGLRTLALTNSTANNKVFNYQFGGSNFSSVTLTSSTIVNDALLDMSNCGVTGRQVVRSNAAFSNSTTAPGFMGVDTTVDQTVQTLITLAVATDYVILLKNQYTLQYRG